MRAKQELEQSRSASELRNIAEEESSLRIQRHWRGHQSRLAHQERLHSPIKTLIMLGGPVSTHTMQCPLYSFPPSCLADRSGGSHQGTGKATYGKKLVQEFGLHHLSIGALLREAVQNKHSRATEISACMQDGELVDEVIVLEILVQTLQRLRFRGSGGTIT